MIVTYLTNALSFRPGSSPITSAAKSCLDNRPNLAETQVYITTTNQKGTMC